MFVTQAQSARIKQTTILVVFILVAAIVGSVVVAVTTERSRFAVLAPVTAIGVEAASALSRLFGALVLALIAADEAKHRLRWMASGLLVLGLGGLLFGYLEPLLEATTEYNKSMHAALAVRTIVSVLFVVAFYSATPPLFSRRMLLAVLGVFAGYALGVELGQDRLPLLVHGDKLVAAAQVGRGPLHWLTAWHWGLASVSVVLASVATLGALRHHQRGTLQGWVVVAMVLFCGSTLHNFFWPSIYTPVLTSADVLRFAFAAVITVGGIWELRRIAAERAALLAAEREHSRRLRDLAQLKADFTAMVAHELGSPVATIQALAAMLATGACKKDEQAVVLSGIQRETETLTHLIADVQNVASVERDDFAVRCRPVRVAMLIDNAATFARALSGAHPISTALDGDTLVLADPDRIGQVLRNLLSNAIKYSAPGAPIELSAVEQDGRVRIAVADHGPGIARDDLRRIFDKFGRGRDQLGGKVAGVGVGLYLSRRIVQAHGSDLGVVSTLGAGSQFAFTLEIVR